MSDIDVKAVPLKLSVQTEKNWLGLDIPVPDDLLQLPKPSTVPHHATQVIVNARGDGDEPHLTLAYGFDVKYYDAVASLVEAERLTDADVMFRLPYLVWPTKARGAAKDGDMAVSVPT